MRSNEERVLKLSNGLTATLCLLGKDSYNITGRYNYAVTVNVAGETLDLFVVYCPDDPEKMARQLENLPVESIVGLASLLRFGNAGGLPDSPLGLLAQESLVKKIPPSICALMSGKQNRR
jgi:hypothetical protein